MIIASQSSVSTDAAPGSARLPARSSRLIAFLAMATCGIGLLSTGISVAQQSPEIVEPIGGAYQMGRLRVTGGMVVQTILYNGRPIATGVMLPARADVASAAGASMPAATGNLETAGTILSGEVSGKYFILHRARGSRSTIHEIFFDGEPIGQVAEEAAPALMGEPSSGNENRGRTTPPTVARGSAFSFKSAGDALVVHIVQPDGTTIRATSRNGGRLEQAVERSAAAVPAGTGNTDRVIPGDADAVVSRNVDRVISGNAGPINSGNSPIANANASRNDAATAPENAPPAPFAGEAKQSVVHDDDATVGSSVGEPLKSRLPKIRIPLPRPPVRTAVRTPPGTPEPPRRSVTSPSPFAASASAAPLRSQRSAAPPRAQISRTAPQRTTP
jgi:hypothetical protein